MKEARFAWDEDKDQENQSKHGVSFALAQYAFLDPHRVIAEDITHSGEEKKILLYGPCGRRDHDRAIYI